MTTAHDNLAAAWEQRDARAAATLAHVRTGRALFTARYDADLWAERATARAWVRYWTGIGA